MTLILNEIHLLDGLRKSFILAAADRRISNPDGSYNSTRHKLFEIPYLSGAISYFGLAGVYPGGKPRYLSEWLPAFIRRQSSTRTLGCFAKDLSETLNTIVPPPILKKYHSGFHICGYDENGFPDFWYVSNIGGWKDFEYIDLQTKYFPAESHFLDRDASKVLGWNHKDPSSARNGGLVYRNGDAQAHVAAWDLLDEIYGRLADISNEFKVPKSNAEYAKYVKFKFEFIAYLYKQWARKKIIGRPIDVLILTSKTG